AQRLSSARSDVTIRRGGFGTDFRSASTSFQVPSLSSLSDTTTATRLSRKNTAASLHDLSPKSLQFEPLKTSRRNVWSSRHEPTVNTASTVFGTGKLSRTVSFDMFSP